MFFLIISLLLTISSSESEELKLKFPLAKFSFFYISSDEVLTEVTEELIKNGTAKEKAFENSRKQALKLYD